MIQQDSFMTFGQYTVCFLFSALCAFTMEDLLTRTFLQGLLADPLVPVAIAMTAFTGFLGQCKWIVWDDPTVRTAPSQTVVPGALK